jgi:ABC-type amino acid transport substrate-binding protein
VRPRRILAAGASALFVSATSFLSAAAAPAPAPLRVCFGEHDAPRSQKAGGAGLDVEVMGLVAERIGRALQEVWLEDDDRLTDIDKSDLPLRNLARGECDAVASVPGEAALGAMKRYLVLSQPYYGAAFELVGPDRLPADLAALKGRKVSVQSASVANLAAVALGLDWTAQPDAKAQLGTLDAGAAQAALVWGPDLGPLGRRPKAGFEPPPALRWNEHVATRAADRDLRAAIDAALSDLASRGKITQLLVKYGVPAHAPFERAFSPQDLAAIRFSGK